MIFDVSFAVKHLAASFAKFGTVREVWLNKMSKKSFDRASKLEMTLTVRG